MLTKSFVAAATVSLLFGLSSTAMAQSLRNADEPAEFPPSSYTGKQYVDSRGCVYVRAGFDGAVRWVPRVARNRQVLCGATPTFASRPAPTPPATVAAAPPAAAPAPAPAPAPTRVIAPPRATVAPAPTRRVVTAPPPARVVKPAPVVRVAPPPRAAAVPAPTVRDRCGVTALSQAYLRTNSGYAVRCGPQTVSPTGISYEGDPSGLIRVAPPPSITPPPGYRAAFEDGRLNTARGIQTAEGYYQSGLIWTNTVPRRLIDPNRRHTLKEFFESLEYAFEPRRSMEEQLAYRPNPRTLPGTLRTGTPPATAPVVRYSTKGVEPVRATPPTPTRIVAPAPVARVAVPAGHRYVQVGTFANPSNANASAARLQAMGLPVRVGNYLKAGKTYRIVMAGPFGSSSSLSAGLSAARRAGFSDAYTRQ